MKRFSLEKKMVVQVRYYETMYLIHDRHGERVFAGTEEKTARTILGALNRLCPPLPKIQRRKPHKRRK
jgi:hypothetical protein